MTLDITIALEVLRDRLLHPRLEKDQDVEGLLALSVLMAAVAEGEMAQELLTKKLTERRLSLVPRVAE